MRQVTEFLLEPASLSRLTTAVEGFCDTAGLDREEALRLCLVVEELLTNAVTHGNPTGGDGRGRLTLELRGPELKLVYEDQGRPFNPLDDAPAAQFDPDVLARPVGGLGVHLVRRLSDHLHYVREDGWNRLTLRRTL